MSYPSDRLFEEVAYVSTYLGWSYPDVMAMDHRERRRWVEEVARMNAQWNEQMQRERSS